MKRICVLLLALSVCLCGCSALTMLAQEKVELPQIEMPQMPETPDVPDLPVSWDDLTVPQPEVPGFTLPQQEEMFPTVETQAPTTQPAETTPPTYWPTDVLIAVEDQFEQVYTSPYGGIYCVHIPQLIWNGQVDTTLKDRIYYEHMEQVNDFTFENGNPGFSAAYSMGHTDKVASVVTVFQSQDYDYTKYSVYHMDLKTGQQTDDASVLASFGYTADGFYDQIRAILQMQYVTNFGEMDGFKDSESYTEMLNQQISDEVIRSSRPYVDESGRLCAVVTFIVPAGSGKYKGTICLLSQDHITTPQYIRCVGHN